MSRLDDSLLKIQLAGILLDMAHCRNDEDENGNGGGHAHVDASAYSGRGAALGGGNHSSHRGGGGGGSAVGVGGGSYAANEAASVLGPGQSVNWKDGVVVDAHSGTRRKLSEVELEKLRKERARMHAKLTRDRKKKLVSTLQDGVKGLEATVARKQAQLNHALAPSNQQCPQHHEPAPVSSGARGGEAWSTTTTSGERRSKHDKHDEGRSGGIFDNTSPSATPSSVLSMAPESVAAHWHERDAESLHLPTSSTADACQSNLMDGRYAFNSGPSATPSSCDGSGGMVPPAGSHSFVAPPPPSTGAGAAAHPFAPTSTPYDAYTHHNSNNQYTNLDSEDDDAAAGVSALARPPPPPTSPYNQYAQYAAELWYAARSAASAEYQPAPWDYHQVKGASSYEPACVSHSLYSFMASQGHPPTSSWLGIPFSTTPHPVYPPPPLPTAELPLPPPPPLQQPQPQLVPLSSVPLSSVPFAQPQPTPLLNSFGPKQPAEAESPYKSARTIG